MHRVALTAFLLLISTNALGLGDQPLIDSEQKKIDEQMNQKILECQNKHKKDDLVRRMGCGKQVRYEYQKRGVVRGTKEYFDAHYKKLDTPELLKLRENLTKQNEKARTVGETDSDPSGRKPGEITKELLRNEILDIELELQDRKAHRKQ
jgi:hypothetical protein